MSQLYASLCFETNGRLLGLMIYVEDGVTVVRCGVRTFHLVQLVIHAMKVCSRAVPGEHPIRLSILVNGKPFELNFGCDQAASVAKSEIKRLKLPLQQSGVLPKGEPKRTPSQIMFSEPIFQTDAFVSSP
ncbi:hypothetical protein [Novipirellula aureliae]|uniref:hypothetical protein n=1 Tax=Novipirellula aureliae TaxID=2527966 RepID=UPI0011B49611|nr:hypothetical protein [Novipirellula aureliae]